MSEKKSGRVVAIQALGLALQVNIPVLLVGEPGCGKTSTIRQITRDLLKMLLRTIIAGIHEPSDFGGLPMMTPDGPILAVVLPQVKDVLKVREAVLFFDEIGSSPGAVQAALQRPIHEGLVGDTPLPPGIRRAAAMNPVDQGAGGYEIAASLANRFLWLNWPTDADYWIEGILSGWKNLPSIPILPKNWEKCLPRAKSLVTGFIHNNRALLQACPKSEAQKAGPWPSERTWEEVIKLEAACEASEAEKGVLSVLVSGEIGEGTALTYFQWRKEMDLPDVEAWLTNPKKNFKLPKRDDMVYVSLINLVQAVCSNLTKERWKAGWECMGMAAEKGATDIAALALRPWCCLPFEHQELTTDVPQAFIKLLKSVGRM